MITIIIYTVLSGCLFTMLWAFFNFVKNTGKEQAINEQNKRVIEDVKDINKKVADIHTTNNDDVHSGMRDKYTRD